MTEFEQRLEKALAALKYARDEANEFQTAIVDAALDGLAEIMPEDYELWP